MLVLTLALMTATGDLGAHHAARLLTDAPLLAQAPLQPPAADADVSWQQLQADIDGLRRARPSIGGGMALTISGGAVALAGGFLMLTGGLAFAGSTLPILSNPIFVIGLIPLIAAAPIILIGVWALSNALEQRGRIDAEVARLRQLQQQRRAREPVAPSLVPGYTSLDRAFLDGPPASAVLATF